MWRGPAVSKLRKHPPRGNYSPGLESSEVDCPRIFTSIGSKPMPDAETFFDTNVLLYLLSSDEIKADRSEDLIANGGVISVQVLNEFAAVSSRKLRMSWSEITEALGPVRAICRIEPVTVETHDRAVEIAARYGY